MEQTCFKHEHEGGSCSFAQKVNIKHMAVTNALSDVIQTVASSCLKNISPLVRR